MISIYTLREHVVNTQTLYAGMNSDSLKNKTIIAYAQKVTTELTRLLHSKELSPQLIQSFLYSNWIFIKGSFLSYTSIPKSPITELMISTARFGLHLSGVNDPTLNHFVQSLMPGLPELLTHEELQAYCYKTPNLPEDITTLLSSHIHSDDLKRFIPVTLLTRLADTAQSSDKIPSPYYEGDHAEKYYLTPCELKRLSNHSDAARALHDARVTYDDISDDESNLLGQLRLLVRMMSLNSVKNLGEETRAGAGGEPALQAFWAFYESLSISARADIPKRIAEQITHIRKCLGKYEPGESIINPIATCLATRSDAMQIAIQGHEMILSQIRLSGDDKASLILKAKNNLVDAHAAFVKEIHSIKYEGHDIQGVTRAILTNLNIHLRFESFQSVVNNISELSPSEITNIYQSVLNRKSAFDRIASLSNLILLVSDLSSDQLAAFTNAFEHELKSLIKTTAIAGSFISCLTLPKMLTFLGSAQWVFSMIKNGSNLNALIRHTSPDQCRAIFQTFESEVAPAIRTAVNFGAALQGFSEDKCRPIFELLGDKVPQLIKTGYDFSSMVQFLPLASKAVVYEAVKESLPKALKTHWELRPIFKQLTPEQCKDACEILKERIETLVTSGRHYSELIKELNKSQRHVLNEGLKGFLPVIIQDAADFGLALEYLTPTERTGLYQSLRDKLSDFISYNADLSPVLQYLTKEEATEFSYRVSMKGRIADAEKILKPVLLSQLRANEPFCTPYRTAKRSASDHSTSTGSNTKKPRVVCS